MKRIFLFAVYICFCFDLFAQYRNIEEIDYRRNSVYSILVNHTEQDWGSYIADVFIDMPLPEKYNDHDLSVKIISVDKRTPAEEKGQDFLVNNNVASHLVARWFNRNPLTGECNMELIKERGLYSASEFDRILSSQSVRGKALLEDAGEDLLANTFVIVNDIRYADKEKAGKIAGAVLGVLFEVAGGVLDGYTGNTNLGKGMAQIMGYAMNQMMQTLKGFNVKVHTHLYRLVWDDATAATFYETMYSEQPDAQKKAAFEANRGLFKLEYVGSQLSSGRDVSFLGVNLDTPDEMIRKACVRAIDENVANLARNFEPFKVKVKLTSASPVQAPVGKKEEITEETLFEVLEPVVKDDRTTYRRVAVIQPVKGMIWDNRYMAAEEGAAGAMLNYTTFKKVSGGEILPGMFIREIGKK